jgi:hypothetical protein
VEELRVGTLETARLKQSDDADDHRRRSHHSPVRASLDDAYACAKDQLDQAARDGFAALRMIEDAVVIFARGQRRDLR